MVTNKYLKTKYYEDTHYFRLICGFNTNYIKISHILIETDQMTIKCKRTKNIKIFLRALKVYRKQR